MTRVDHACQSTNHFVPEELPQSYAPQAKPQQSTLRDVREGAEKNGKNAAKMLRDLLTKKAQEKGQSTAVSIQDEQIKGMTEVFIELGVHLAVDGGFHLGTTSSPMLGAFGQVMTLALPASAAWSLLSGLATIGQTHRDAALKGEQDAVLRGLAETLGPALDDPSLAPAQLEGQALQSKHVRHFAGLAQASQQLSISQEDRQHYARLAEKYLNGARCAVHLLENTSIETRQTLATLLQGELDGPDMTSRLLDHFRLAH